MKDNIPINLNLKQSKQGNYGSSVKAHIEPQTQRGIEVRDHCHRQRSEGVDVKARRKLIIASILCLFFMIAEIIGGVWSNSLAIATDAAHLLTDFASFMISLFAIWIAGRPSTQRMSFGWYRAEVIGALVSVVMIWFITAILVWLAIERLINRDFEVDSKIMLITSGLAILVNLIMGVQLQHGHSHGGGGGHSHGDGKKSNKKQQTLADPTSNQQYDNFAIEIDATPKRSRPADSNGSGITLTGYKASPATPENVHDVNCPDTIRTFNTAAAGQGGSEENTEGGADVDVDLSEATLPAAGLRSFSYQNSQSVNEAQVEIAAVLAETAPGGHHHGGAAAKEAVNLNVRAAFIHVLGDMVQSVGVFLAALLIYFRPDWAIADPICTFIFSIIVLFTTFAIMKDALLVLMEGTPPHLQKHYTEVLGILQQVEGVQRVHNLRIWALSINKTALSAHLAIGPGSNPKKVLDEATRAVHLRYNFFETTIQIENSTPDMENCQQCLVPEK